MAYKGAGQAMTDLVAGHVKAGFMTMQSAIPHAKSKTLAALAVSSGQRVPDLPDVPTFKELGVDLVSITWFVISGPARMPAAVVVRLNTEIAAVWATPDVKARNDRDGVEYEAMSPASLTQFIAAEAVALGRRRQVRRRGHAMTRPPLSLAALTILDAGPAGQIRAAAASGWTSVGLRLMPLLATDAHVVGDADAEREIVDLLAEHRMDVLEIGVFPIKAAMDWPRVSAVLAFSGRIGARFAVCPGRRRRSEPTRHELRSVVRHRGRARPACSGRVQPIQRLRDAGGRPGDRRRGPPRQHWLGHRRPAPLALRRVSRRPHRH